MLYCASYHEPQNHHGELISISRSVPKGIKVTRHLDFFKPTQDLLQWWKTTSQDESAWSEYTSRFWSILSDRKTQILDWIHGLGRKPTHDMTLLCWEKAGTYCHRNLVARLLQKHSPEWFGGCDVPRFQVGDHVMWLKAYGYLTFLEPFEIRAIEGDHAYLHWISSSVKLAELRKIE